MYTTQQIESARAIVAETLPAEAAALTAQQISILLDAVNQAVRHITK